MDFFLGEERSQLYETHVASSTWMETSPEESSTCIEGVNEVCPSFRRSPTHVSKSDLKAWLVEFLQPKLQPPSVKFSQN